MDDDLRKFIEDREISDAVTERLVKEKVQYMKLFPIDIVYHAAWACSIAIPSISPCSSSYHRVLRSTAKVDTQATVLQFVKNVYIILLGYYPP